MTSKMLMLLILAIGSATAVHFNTRKTCNVVPASKRINCGYDGITQAVCKSKGCCWETNVRDAPWCYRPEHMSTTIEPPGPDCLVGHHDNRVDCGFGGITEYICRQKGCCWDSTVFGVPWCFRRPVTTTPRITTQKPTPNCAVGPPSKRVNCGFPGIQPDVCRQRGCCWDQSVRGVPWCFFGNDKLPYLKCEVGDPRKRINCGHRGIQPYACLQRSCCWDDSVADVPWCFRNVSTTTTTVPSTTVTQPPTAHCDVPLRSRKRCGRHGVNREQCLYKGCCWQTWKTYGIPSCYFAASKPGPDGCDPWLPNRLTCGYVGIKEKQCLEKACCWDDSRRGRPKCYVPNSGCPHSFTYVPSVNGCYYFEQNMMNWHLANRYCTRRHPKSQLIVITSAAEQNAVSEFLFSKSANTETHVWTAGYRVNTTDSPSSFIWRVVTANHYFKLPHRFTDWAPREPNGGEAEYCMALDVYQNYRWFDVSCARNHHVLCEIDIA